MLRATGVAACPGPPASTASVPPVGAPVAGRTAKPRRWAPGIRPAGSIVTSRVPQRAPGATVQAVSGTCAEAALGALAVRATRVTARAQRLRDNASPFRGSPGARTILPGNQRSNVLTEWERPFGYIHWSLMARSDALVVSGAREHKLRDITVALPRDALVVITGLSGSGKSSLAFDTIYAEGQRRYVESLSPYARQFLGQMDKPDVDSIEGLSPAISIDQKTTSRNPRSTVGTITEIYDYL